MQTKLRQHVLPLVVAVAAIAIRLATFTPDFSLRKGLVYDDVAYFGGAQMFVEGHAPYRGFPFVQPPGVAVVASPFAVIGRFFGGDVGMATLRVAMILMAGLTCWMVAKLLVEHGVVAQLAGSVIVVFHTLSVLGSRTFYLEPFLAFAVVATFWLLETVPDRRRWYVATGFVLGVACSIKIWALADVAAFALMIGVTRGRRRLTAWMGGVIAAVAVVVVPFFVFAPRQMWQQVIASQLGRGGGMSMLDRLRGLDGYTGFPGMSVVHPSPTTSALVTGLFVVLTMVPLVTVLVRAERPREWHQGAWWALVALVELAVLAAAPVFYSHYLDWPLPALALGFGWTVGRVTGRWTRLPLLALIAVLVVVLAVTPLRWRKFAVMLPVAPARTFAAAHRCTFFDSTAMQSFAVSPRVPFGARCRRWPDPIGVVIIDGGAKRIDPLFATRGLAVWQSGLRAQMWVADSAVMCTALDSEPWDAQTRALFVRRFEPTGAQGGWCTYWVKRPRLTG